MTAFFRDGLTIVLWIVTDGDGEEMTYLGIDGTWTELTRERRDESQSGSANFIPSTSASFMNISGILPVLPMVHRLRIQPYKRGR